MGRKHVKKQPGVNIQERQPVHRRPLETVLRRLRHYVVNDNKYLALVSVTTFSVQSIGYIATDTWGDKPWWGWAIGAMVILWLLFVWILYTYISNIGDINVTRDANAVLLEDHNIRVMKKCTGNALSLAIFAVLDSTLKSQIFFWVVVVCASFYILMVHMLVIFNVNKDLDIVGGFLTASFVLLYEMTTIWWQTIPLVIILVIFSNYKSLLFEGLN